MTAIRKPGVSKPQLRYRLAAGAMLLLGTSVLAGSSLAYDLTQVLTYVGNGSDHYTWQESYILTPDPALQVGDSVAAPNGCSQLYSAPYVESGAMKDCRSGSCVYHPYASWEGPGTKGQNIGTDNLMPGGSYQYVAYQHNGNYWAATFCSGYGCKSLAYPDLGTDWLKYAVTGAESMPYGVHFGTVTSSWHRAKKNGDYVYWCYSGSYKNVSEASISACDTSNYSWTITY